MTRRTVWVPRLLAATAMLTWALANGVDIFSVLFLVQTGGLALPVARLRPAEFFLAYAGLRLLGAIAVALAIPFVSKHWPAARSAAWSGLTAFSLVTTLAAWLRLYR